jgi:hypothetical protein
MLKHAPVFAALLTLTLTLALGTMYSARAANKESNMLRHMVLYKFKHDLAPGEVQEVIDAFAALPGKIDTIVGFEHGTNTSQEGKSDGLTHAFVVTFRDRSGLETYLKHPAHLAYVDVVKNRREKVVVFDYEVP